MSSINLTGDGRIRYFTSQFSNAGLGSETSLCFWYKPNEITSTNLRRLAFMNNQFLIEIPANTTSISLIDNGTTVFSTKTLTGIIDGGLVFIGVTMSSSNLPRIFTIKEDGSEVFRNVDTSTAVAAPDGFHIGETSTSITNGANGLFGCVRVFDGRLTDTQMRIIFNSKGQASYDVGNVAIAWDFTEITNGGVIDTSGQIKNIVGNYNNVITSIPTTNDIITGGSGLPLYYRRRMA